MKQVRVWWNVLRRDRLERDLDDELQTTLALLVEEKIRSGIERTEAVRQARMELGTVESIKDDCRRVRGVLWLDELTHDIHYALRTLARAPGFTAAALATLALGIGSTTAMFSVAYSVLLKPLPFDEPERLVSLAHRAPDGDGRNQGPATYFTYRQNQRAFEDIGGWDRGEATITGGGDPEQINVLRVTDAVLPLLKVQPLLGRVFTKEDDAPGRPLRAILTYGYWQRRFGGVTNVIGQPLVIDGQPAAIIGVLRPSFTFPRSNDAVMLLPMQLNDTQVSRSSFGFDALARLKPGVTIEQAEADVARMIALLPPGFLQRLRPVVRSQAADVIGDAGEILWILFGAVALVLLIACGNAANLFLVRAEGRRHDLGVRAALGAGRGRLARVLLSESVLLALAGGALGLLLAQAIIRLVRQLAELPRLNEISIDATVLSFTLCISTLTGVVFGVIVVVNLTKRAPITLTRHGRSDADAPRRHRTRNTLVVGQIALALTLMIVSGLLVRTVVALRQVVPGFTEPETVQTFRISIPSTLISDNQRTARTFESIARSLEQVPGVTSVGLSSSITMDGENNSNWIEAEEFLSPEGAPASMFRFKSVAPGYFVTMGIPIVAGRSIEWTDIYADRAVVMVSENVARKFWQLPARALGKRIRSGSDRPWREIVGVVGNERDDGLDHPETAIVYWPLLSGYGATRRTMAYAVRSDRVGTAPFQRELESAVWSVNPNLPLAAVHTVEEIRDQSMRRASFAMVMLSLAAGVALLLAVVGIFGVITYVAKQRTREVGIRMALGSQLGEVRMLFLRQGLWLTAAGIAIGIGFALLVSRVLSAFLFGVAPADPETYIAVSGILAVAALVATYLPAWRAARADPLIALRGDL